MAVAPDSAQPETSGRRFLQLGPLIRAVGLGGDARKLVLGAVGLALLVLGWRLIDSTFGIDSRDLGDIDPGATLGLVDPRSRVRWSDLAWMVTEPARIVVGPFVALFTRGVGVRLWFWALLKGVWALMVWGVLGGAIARIAMVQLTVGRAVGIASAIRFALGRALTLIGAPLTPFLAVALISAGSAGFGLLYWIPGGIGATIAGVLGFVPLLASVMMALILVGLALGWPLMHATVAAEGEDVADALSRSYSYVNQRGLRYIGHLATAWGLGIVGLIVALIFARAVLGLADWSVSLGAPTPPTTLPASIMLNDFWTSVVAWLAHSYIYGYFWSAIAAIYLILRQDVDGTDPHDVYLSEQMEDAFAGSAHLPEPASSEPVEEPEPPQPS